MNSIQNRLKSKAAWVSISSLLLLVLGHLGFYEKVGITQPEIQIIIDMVLSIISGFGIFNNPTNSTGY